MKIGIEAQRIFRPKKHGMDIYALELIRAIQEMDTQNEYVVFVKPDKDICLKPSKNLKIIELKAQTYLDWEQFALPKAIEKEGIELMHFTSNTAPMSIKCPFVLTLHDIIYLEKKFSAGSFYQIAGHFYRRLVVPKVVLKAKAVLTVSDFEKGKIENYFLNKSVKFIYNAYNQQFKLIEDKRKLKEIAEKYHLPSEFIFFLGNQAPKKNMKRVLEAYCQYVVKEQNPIPLVIAESSEKEVLKLLKSINQVKILPKILLIGYVLHQDLPAIYNLSKLFLYPSLRESFGIPIIEAMACGTPVITSNTSAMPEVAGDAAMLVNPYDSELIAHAISKTLNDKSFYQYLRINGLKRATAFSWKETAKQTINVYQSIF